MTPAIVGIEADAVHDDLRGVVEVAGQLMGAAGALEAIDVHVRTSWGEHRCLTSGRLGAFGVLLASGLDRRGSSVTVSCPGASVSVSVR